MELPHLGEHCSKPNCKRLDFLPIKCDACSEIFCKDHFFYLKHDCKHTYQKDNQVPVCPLCNKPIPVGKDEQPDAVVGAHIDTDCQYDPAKHKRKVFNYSCSFRKCKKKEIMPFRCRECDNNFCLSHRNALDHVCEKKTLQEKTLSAALTRQKEESKAKQRKNLTEIQGDMTEDEALAKAMAMSMRGQVAPSKTQAELDLELARQLQANEYASRSRSTTTAANSRNNQRDTCNVI